MTASDNTYQPQLLETHWQAAWAKARAYSATGQGKPFYVLEMFPYPSGDLHMGHVRNYTIGDVLARYHRMQGCDVLHPMGWDALGLPAENQAIREKIAPQVRTPKNIARMKAQMQHLGLGYDWQREIATYQPEYYRWNQWFFLQMLKKGLVYRRAAQVNWCPGCDTVLANEQVLDDNTCWRGHPGVTTRTIPEWAFKITTYAEELLADLEQLTHWPNRIVNQQRHWLGKSEGAQIIFQVVGKPDTLAIFTTRLDTIYGCTYLVVAPDHAFVQTLPQTPELTAFIKRMQQIDKRERTADNFAKEGVFTGHYAINPFSHEQVPIWLANFVLADYGTGAVMSVPAHDQRDFEFAHKYHLPIHPVVQAPANAAKADAAYTGDGTLEHSGLFDGLTCAEARQRMIQHAEQHSFGTAKITWHLRDWGFSRQRYWGTPIPIIYCNEHGAVPVPEADLPVVLPDFADINLTGQGGAPLSQLSSFHQTTCPICQKPGVREVETMDTFVDSAWYFARFLSPQCTTAPFLSNDANTWLPVDIYVGGPEHAVMHLLYFRFWTKVMRDLGLVQIDEPVRQLITQGMIHAASYKCPNHGYQAAQAFKGLPAERCLCSQCQTPLVVSLEKMSKSKYNGIDPLELIETYGADTARLYTLFAAPPEKDLEWEQSGVEGLHRFLNRVWRLATMQATRVQDASLIDATTTLSHDEQQIYTALHKTLAKVTAEMNQRYHFNTAIAALMELVNTLYTYKLHEPSTLHAGLVREMLLTLAQMLAPFAPHIAEYIWHTAGGQGFVIHASWPKVNEQAIVGNTVTLAIQVNGKLRAQIDVDIDADEATVVALAQQNPQVAKYLSDKSIRKQIYVPKRLLNFVV